MAEITRKRIGEIVRKAFSILLEYPEGLPAKELLSQLSNSLTLSDFEKSDYPNSPGVRRFEKIARFATIAPVKAGWLVKSKGRWIVTEEGKTAFKQYPDPEEFARQAADLYHKWRDTQPDAIPDTSERAVQSAATTLEEAEELAWSEIQRYLQAMNPYDLQALVAALLRGMGYHVSWVSPPGPDRGIDIVAHTDPLGTTNPRIKVQVKRHEKAIQAEGLRAFMAVLGDQDVGIFVSTGGFSSGAEREARTQEKRRITLVDLEKLFELWTQHYEKLSELDKQLLPLKPIYYLAAVE
jgi:restriction system protein